MFAYVEVSSVPPEVRVVRGSVRGSSRCGRRFIKVRMGETLLPPLKVLVRHQKAGGWLLAVGGNSCRGRGGVPPGGATYGPICSGGGGVASWRE